MLGRDWTVNDHEFGVGCPDRGAQFFHLARAEKPSGPRRRENSSRGAYDFEIERLGEAQRFVEACLT